MVDLPLRFYQWGWAVFGVYFVILEGLALLDAKQGDTLSENIRWIRAQHPVLLGFLIGTLITWLYFHFLFEERVGNT